MLAGYGVTHIFFTPCILPAALVEMDDLPITRISTHGEKAAAYMADGYARALNRPGICMAQVIGAANLAAGLKDAYMAFSPVIALTGGPSPNYEGRKVYQEVDDFAMFEPVTKFNARVGNVTRLPDMLRQAFRAATTGCPGPVHLQLQGHWGQEIEGASGDLDITAEGAYAAVPPYRPEPTSESVATVGGLLMEARRPLIIAGGGVTSSRAEHALVALAEKLSIPVATSLNAKGAIRDDHPLAVGVVGSYSRESANRIAFEADLVFFIGSQVGSQVTNKWKLLNPAAKVVQLDIDATQLGRHYPNEASLACDANRGLLCLIESVSTRPTSEWNARVGELVEAWRVDMEPHFTSDAIPMRPERICKEISRVLPNDGVVVNDTGHSAMWALQALDLVKSNQRFIRCAGSLGWGLPATIGVKAALPGRTVIGFTGDGGFYYHLAELETAARHGINMVLVVNNNEALSQEAEEFDPLYAGRSQPDDSLRMWHYSKLNLGRVAETLGCAGFRAESPAELRDALEQGLAADKPVVIDARSQFHAMAPAAWSSANIP
jgi:acetolactate synthase-1/2/3 large subunit